MLPKPMVQVGGHPLLWHIMKHYAHHGHRDFLLALGYRGSTIKDYFLRYAQLSSDLEVNLRTGDVKRTTTSGEDWTVRLVDTGQQTMTGGRLLRLASHLRGGTFMMTYGDGLSNVDLSALLSFHKAHGRLATVTAVRPAARFGALQFESASPLGGPVRQFHEKPQLEEGWINGGFFVLEPGVLDYVDGDDSYWEREPLERLAAEGQLAAYAHDDFWQCMDTQRDVERLESLWEGGAPPWRSWS